MWSAKISKCEDLEHLGAFLTRAIEAGTVEAMMDLLDKVASIKRHHFRCQQKAAFSKERHETFFVSWKFCLSGLL